MTGKAIHGFAVRKGKLSPVYSAWRGMRQRCLNPNNPGYKYYGARGIRVCEQWSRFATFLADMGEPPPHHSLDRIDCNGDYGPSNCRWADKRTQVLNRRPYSSPGMSGPRNHQAKLTWAQVREIRQLGQTLTGRAIAERFSLSPPCIGKILRGETYKEAA